MISSKKRNTSVSLSTSDRELGHVDIPAQELLKLHSSATAGFIRRKEKLGFTKWQQRYVIITRDRIFIYDNETSKSPKISISLLGYKGVSRHTSKSNNVPWSFYFVPGWPSMRQWKFSCASDKDRLYWMKAVKNAMYTGNCIDRPSTPLDDKLRTVLFSDNQEFHDTNIEAEYMTTEMLVWDNIKVNDNNSSDSELDNDYNDGEENEISKRVSDISCSSSASEGVTAPIGKRSSAGALRGLPTECFISDSIHSGRGRRTEQLISADYANLSGLQIESRFITLEQMCSAVDSDQNRDELVSLLNQKPVGTYLIRKSRKADSKVLSFHCQQGDIKEFKIFEMDDQVSLDGETCFPCINTLLRYYTKEMKMIGCVIHLQCGIYHDTIQSEQEQTIYELIT